MNVATIRMLFDYNYWAHGRVWDCVMQLSEAKFTQPLTYSVGSIHAQMVHTMSAEHIWFSRIRGESPRAMFTPADYPTREAIRAKWDEIEHQVCNYLEALRDDMLLGGTIQYQKTDGALEEESLIGVLLHLVNHGTDHRAQVLAMIDRIDGPKTVAQDMVAYLREKTA